MCGDLELGIRAGDLVGVIQQKDPMGARARWFCDNGVTKVSILVLSCRYKSHLTAQLFRYLLLSVIQQRRLMGAQVRWFCDNGAIRFVYKGICF